MAEVPVVPALSAATVTPQEDLAMRARSVWRTQAFVILHARRLGALRVVWHLGTLWLRFFWGGLAVVVLTLGVGGLATLVGGGVMGIFNAVTEWLNTSVLVGGVAGAACAAPLGRHLWRQHRQGILAGRERILWRVERHVHGVQPYPWPELPSLVGWRGVTLFTGWMALMWLPSVVPNLFQLKCEDLAAEGRSGLVAIQQAQRAFHEKEQRYGTLQELRAAGLKDPNRPGGHYRFYVQVRKDQFVAMAADWRNPINRNHPRDTWLVQGVDDPPKRWDLACRE